MTIVRRNKKSADLKKDKSSIIAKTKEFFRELTGRYNRIKQDRYILIGMIKELVKHKDQKNFFKCEKLKNGKYGVVRFGDKILYNMVDSMDKKFDELLNEAKTKYPVSHKGESSIEICWQKCTESMHIKDNYIDCLCRVSSRNIEQIGKVEILNLRAARAWLNFMMINGNTEWEKFFSSIASSYKDTSIYKRLISLIVVWDKLINNLSLRFYISFRKSIKDAIQKNNELGNSTSKKDD